jgi:GNAT superfamily N-acetyltransferase
VNDSSLVRPQIKIESFDSSLHSQKEISEMRNQVRIWQLAEERISASDFAKPQKDLLEINERYLLSGGNFFVAKDFTADTIIGCVGFLHDKECVGGAGDLKRMVVQPEYHRLGIGTKLFEALKEYAERVGCKWIRLTTGKNECTLDFYSQLGFVQTGVIEENGDITMELEL